MVPVHESEVTNKTTTLMTATTCIKVTGITRFRTPEGAPTESTKITAFISPNWMAINHTMNNSSSNRQDEEEVVAAAAVAESIILIY